MKTIVAVWLCLTVDSFSAAPFDPGAAAGRLFTNKAVASGVAGAIADHYRAHPNWWLSGLNLVDLDGDGKLDLFLSAHGTGSPLALLADGNARFKVAPGSYPSTELHLACDINEDGKLDLQMTHGDGGGKWWINESVPGRLAFRDSGITAGQARCNAMIDVNRDGKLDWLHERPGVVSELGDGTGQFHTGSHFDVAQTRNEFNIHPADVNGDGFIDLMVHWGRYDLKQGRSRIYLNDGKGGFQDGTAGAGLAEDGLTIKGAADANQDGSLDLIAFEGRTPVLYLGDGNGHFTKKADAFAGMERASRPNYTSWGLAVVADFDNDGVADILWNGRNFLWALRGLGGGRFVYANKEWGIDDKAAATVDDGLCFGDIDGDGDLDIIGYTGKLDGQRTVAVYQNQSPPRAWLRVRLVGAKGNRAAAGAKIRITEHESAQPGKVAERRETPNSKSQIPNEIERRPRALSETADNRGSPARDNLLWFEQVQILDSQMAHGYYSLAQTERHFGLGARQTVDVTVEFYPSGKRVVKKGANAGSIVTLDENGR